MPALKTGPPANTQQRFIDEIAMTNLSRMIWLLLTSTTLSIILLVVNLLDVRQWQGLPWQILDVGGSGVFLVLFWLGLKRRLPSRIRWLLSPAYFAFWLVLMTAYYFLALPLYGENMTFVLGAVTPAVIILVPPRLSFALLVPYYLAFLWIVLHVPAVNVGRNAQDIDATLINGTLAVLIASLAAWFLYSARRATFEKEQLLAGRNADIHRAETRLRALLENIPFQAWLKDLDGHYMAVNGEFAKAQGQDQHGLIGRRTTDLYSTERAQGYLEEDRDIIRTATRRQYEQCVEDEGRVHWFEVFKSPVLDDQGNCLGTAGLARDITERKRMEEQLLAATQAKSEFLAAMSHEIRTPMNSVLGYAQLLRELPLDAIEREYVDSISSSGNILLCVINDILDFSRIEAGQLVLSPSTFALRPLLDRCLRMFEPPAREKKLRLTLELGPDLPENLQADSPRLEQILINLLSNAVKFTDRGFVILRARIGGSGMLHFEVADTGIGISPAQLDRLFQPFSQADTAIARRFSGTGLGLVITQRLCRLMGGDVRVTSTPGEGSTFTASLPLPVAATGPLPASPEHSPETPLDLSRLRVLVVEDNDPNRKLVTVILRRWKIEAAVASGGEPALALVKNHAFDAILMDVQMPGMDGFETTRHIRAWEKLHPDRPRIHIIALTALAMTGDAERCLEAGMDDYLTKPIQTGALQRALHFQA